MAPDPLINSSTGVALIGACGEEYGRILRVNRELAELLSRPVEQLVGSRLCQHVHHEDHTLAHSAFLGLMADPRTFYESRGRLLAATGDAVPVVVCASTITLRGGVGIVLRVLPDRPRPADR
jgi:PAS domain-containing protein